MKRFNKNPICEECGKNEAISFSFFEDKQAMRTRLPDLEEFDALFESPAVAVWEVSALIDRLEAIWERKKSALINAKLAAIAKRGEDPREMEAACNAAFTAVHSAMKNTVRYRTLAKEDE